MTDTEFEKEILPLRDRMYRYAHRILCDGPAAQDATHDTLELLWRRRAALSAARNPEALAMVSVRNRCIDMLRRRRKFFDAGKAALPAGEAADAWDTIPIVEQAVGRLPQRQREAFHLHDVEGYSSEEIAVLLSTSQAQVRVYLSRARTALRDMLTKTMNHGL